MLGFSLGRIQGIPSRVHGVSEREKTREASLDRAKSARQRERDIVTRWGVQSLAVLYFLLWLLYPKLVHF